MDVVLADVTTIIESAHMYGLELNWGKCEVFYTGGSTADQEAVVANTLAISPLIRIVKDDSLELLGSRITFDAIPSAIDKKTFRLRTMAGKLEMLPGHQALFLLRNCLNLPRLL